MLLIVAIITIIFFKKPDRKTMRFVLFAALFILFLYVVVGVYTPNTGSIVRYRTPAMPLLAALMFAMWDLERVRIKLINPIMKKAKLITVNKH
jgi:hypothetical protein